jgi:hypothetical protein
MDFDFKITTWERVTVNTEDEQRVLDGIKDGSIRTAQDIFTAVGDANLKKLDEVDETMSVSENGGCSTIEVAENGEVIFKNGE